MVTGPAAASDQGGGSAGLEVELCRLDGLLLLNSEWEWPAAAATADAAGPGGRRGADVVIPPPGIGPGCNAACGGDGAQGAPASAASQPSCACSKCRYLAWRGVLRLPLERLWPEREEPGDSKLQWQDSW